MVRLRGTRALRPAAPPRTVVRAAPPRVVRAPHDRKRLAQEVADCDHFGDFARVAIRVQQLGTLTSSAKALQS